MNCSRHALWSTSVAEHEPTADEVMSITMGVHEARVVCVYVCVRERERGEAA